MRKINIDLEKLKLEYLENKKNTLECASIFGVSESVIRRRLKELNIKIRSSSESIKIKTNIDNNIIVDLYWKQGLSISEVAKKLGRSDNFIKIRLKQSGFGTRSISDGARKWRKTDHISDEQIIDLYEKQKWSLEKISNFFNKSPDFARQRLIAIKYKRRDNGRENNRQWKGDVYDNHDLFDKIKADYNNGESIRSIMNKYNIGFDRLRKGLLDLNINLRNQKDAIQLFNIKIPTIKHFEICNRYINNKTESCHDIAEDYDVAPETIGNILKLNGIKPENYGSRLKSYKGGITCIHDMIRCGSRYNNWRSDVFDRFSYRSCISNKGGNLNCHHLTPFSILLQTIIKKHMILLDNDQLYKYSICQDERFYDLDNGLCILEDEHKQIEKTNLYGHPYWRIWKCFPEFVIKNQYLSEDSYYLFNKDGQINPESSIIYKDNFVNAKNLIRYEHYLGTIPTNSIILISRVQNIITGIACFGKGSNKNIKNNCLELTRLCIPYYVIRHFGSLFLRLCYKYIKENYPQIKTLISYVDPSVGHNGGIYRMAGWEKNGKTKSSYSYFNPFVFKLLHKSCCRRIKDVDKTEKQIVEEKGFIKIPLPPKYRYIYNLY